MCSARAYLPEALVDEALAFETEAGEAQPDLVQRHLRCTLEEHEAIGLHHAIVMELNGEETGAVWARWMADRLMSPRSFPGDLLVLPDCPEQSDAQQPCREAAGHRGGHSWEINDPWTEPSYALSR